MTILLRVALSAYRRGFDFPLAVLLRSCRASIAATIVAAPDSNLVRALLSSIANRAVATRDLAMIELIASLPISDAFTQATIHAACGGWKAGYGVLRARQKDRPVLGLSLEAAYLVDDCSAFDRSGPAACIREDVREFWNWVRTAGLPMDDAIDFLTRANLEWAVDYALGLEPNIRGPE